MAESIVLDFILRMRDEGVAGAAAAVDDLNKQYEQNQKATAKASGAQKDFAGSMQLSEAQMSRLRYANYDLSRTMLTLSAAIAGVGAATLTAFASQESAFTEVERILAVNGESVGSLRQDLIDLSTQIPLSFQDLSSIAAIGAALDIAADDLADFASVVGRTSAVTGTSTDEVGAAIARLQQYTGAGFEQLSSAILTAGNVAIATEQEVIRFSQALALPGAQAGFTAEQIIGLAAATSSFANINTQGAGTAFATTLDTIARSASEGGERLELLAELSGTTAAEFQQGWAAGNTSELFNKVMAGLSQDVQGLSESMSDLGIHEKRQRRVISGLAQNWSTVAPILEKTGGALEASTALSQAYGYTLDDLSTRFSVFINAVTNAAAAVGGALAPSIIGILDPLTQFLNFVTDIASSPVGGAFVQMAAGVTALVGVVALLRGGLALATAGVIGYRQATAGTVAVNGGLMGQLRLLISLLAGTGTAAATAAGGVGAVGAAAAGTKLGGFRNTLSGILGVIGGPWTLAFGLAAGAVGLLTSKLNEAINAQREDVKNAFLESGSAAEGLATALEGSRVEIESGADAWSEYLSALQRMEDVDLKKYTEPFAPGNPEGDVKELERAFEDLGIAMASQANNIPLLRNSFAGLVDEMGIAKSQLPEFISLMGPEFEEALNGQLEAAGLATTAQNRLALLYGETAVNASLAEQGIGGAMTATQEAELAAEEATAAYDELKNAFLNLNSTQMDAQAAQDAAQRTLNRLRETAKDFTGDITGSTDAAIDFRAQIRQMELDNRKAAVATLENGKATDKTAKSFGAARTELINTIAPFFESRAAAKKWAESVLGDTNTALDAVEELGGGLDDLGKKKPEPEVDLDTKKAKQELNGLNAELNRFAGRTFTAYARVQGSTSGSTGGGGFSVSNPGFAAGGYTGRGHKYAPAGIVHKGEYVIPKHLVNQSTGLPNADALGKLVRGTASPDRGYANGGYVQPAAGPSSMSLTPATIQQLANAVRTQIMIDGNAIGKAVSQNAIKANSRGAL